MADDVRELAAELRSMRVDVAGIRRAMAVPQLPHSSLDNASVPEKDASGQVVSRWGKQSDGTHGVVIYGGPIPPQPATPVVEGGPVSLTATWGGTYVGGVGRLDFHVLEVYAAREPFQHIEEAELVGAIPDPDGGRVTFARPVGEWYVGLAVRSYAGKRSRVSPMAVGTAESVLDSEVLDDLDARLTALANTLEDLDAEALQALQGRLAVLSDEVLPGLTDRIQEAETTLGPLPGRLAEAEAAATAAQGAASDAEQAALDAAGIAEGKGQIIVQTSRPSGSRARAENLWVRLPDYKTHVYDGERWVAATDPDLITAAETAATARQEAQDALDRAEALEGQVGTLQASLGEAEAALGTLRDTTLPGLTGRLESVEYDLDHFSAEWITAGTLDTDRLNANEVAAAVATFLRINSDQIVAGLIQGEQIDAESVAARVATVIELNADRITSGIIATGRLDAQEIAAAVGSFLEIAAEQIVAGELSARQIDVEDVFAEWFRTNLVTARHADLGSFAADEGFIASLRTATLTVGGPWTADELDDLPASKIGSGTLSSLRIPTLAQSKISGLPGRLSTHDETTSRVNSWTTTGQTTIDGGRLTTDSVKAVAVDTGSLVADIGFIQELDSALITSDVFQGREFLGGAFTGSTFRTSLTGDRMQMDTFGLRSWKGGRLETEIGGSGRNFLSGFFSTSLSGEPGVLMGNAHDTGLPALWFAEDGTGSGNNPAVWTDADWNLWLRGKRYPDGSRTPVSVVGGLRIASGGVGNDHWMIGNDGAAYFRTVQAREFVGLGNRGPFSLTNVPGWNVGRSYYQVINGWCFVALDLQRTGGNIARGVSNLWQFPSYFSPTNPVFQSAMNQHTNQVALMEYDPLSHVMSLHQLTVDTGQRIRAFYSWPSAELSRR